MRVEHDAFCAALAHDDRYSPWPATHYEIMLRQRGVMGRVIDLAHSETEPSRWANDDLVGVIICQVAYRKVILHRIVIAPDVRRRGYGSALLRSLDRHLDTPRVGRRRDQLECEVHERMVECQLFLRACGWQATHVVGERIQFRCTPATIGQSIIQRLADGDNRVRGV